MKKLAIKMLATAKGAEDQRNAKEYVKDEVYTVGEGLADVFVKGGLAVYVNDKDAAKEEAERKANLEKALNNIRAATAFDEGFTSDDVRGRIAAINRGWELANWHEYHQQAEKLKNEVLAELDKLLNESLALEAEKELEEQAAQGDSNDDAMKAEQEKQEQPAGSEAEKQPEAAAQAEAAPPVEAKATEAAPENKAVEAAPANKKRGGRGK